MGILSKILAPILLGFICLSGIVHFYWGPSLFEDKRQELVSDSLRTLETIAPSVTRFLLSRDLAELYSTLNDLLEANSGHWVELIVKNRDGKQIYPLRKTEITLSPGQIEKTYTVKWESSELAEMTVVIDITQELEKEYKRIQVLELYTLMIFGILALTTAVWLNFVIRRPIKELQLATHLMAKGKFDINLAPYAKRGDEIGKLTHSFITMRDNLEKVTSDLTETAHDAHSNELRQRTIVNNISDGIIITDGKLQITFMNPAAEKLFLYSNREARHQNINIFFTAKVQQLRDDDEIYQVEKEGIKKGGDIFPLEFSMTRVLIDEEELCIIIARDISERKRVDKMKSEFVSTVSHELRTPLTAIRGAVGLARSGIAGEFNEQMNQLLTMASNNTERLLILVNDLLDMQKIEAGEMQFNFLDVEVAALLQQAVDEYSGYAEQQKVFFVLEHIEGGVFIKGDQHRLMQVLGNLLSNAAKFSHQGEAIRVNMSVSDSNVTISVCDKGPGISEDFLPKLFERFTQADSSDTRKVSGTGLGLPITKALVEKHGGTIDVDTQLGEGATFFVTFPRVYP